MYRRFNSYEPEYHYNLMSTSRVNPIMYISLIMVLFKSKAGRSDSQYTSNRNNFFMYFLTCELLYLYVQGQLESELKWGGMEASRIKIWNPAIEIVLFCKNMTKPPYLGLSINTVVNIYHPFSIENKSAKAMISTEYHPCAPYWLFFNFSAII